jgi:hypothetical protein
MRSSVLAGCSRKALFSLIVGVSFSAAISVAAQEDTLSGIKNEFYVAFDGWGMAEQLVVSGKYSVNGKMGWIHKNSFAVTVEGGHLNFSRQVSDSIKSFDYRSSGYYVRGGFERNINRRNRRGERNFIFLGMHIGYSRTQHRAQDIVIPDRFWGTRYYSFGTTDHQYVWIDFSVGLRTQLSRHFALGWEVKINRKIYNTGAKSIMPYYMAGFGKTTDPFALGVSYYLFYTLGK